MQRGVSGKINFADSCGKYDQNTWKNQVLSLSNFLCKCNTLAQGIEISRLQSSNYKFA